MQIDSQMIAQVLTTVLAFFIFFWLSKKLFWPSVMKTIEDRQAKITSEFDKIDSMQRQVDQLQADYTKRMSDIEAEARLKLQEAMAQGKQIAEEVAAQARRDADETRQKAHQTVAIELDKAKAELKQDVVRMTLAATEKLIRQNMNESRQQELVNNFVEELSHR